MNYYTLSVGCTPCDESCEQLGPNYNPGRAKAECRAYINQLKRQFGEPPPDTSYRITNNPHDFGTYHEVEVKFNTEDEESVEYAFKVEGESPEKWDREAKKELRRTI